MAPFAAASCIPEADVCRLCGDRGFVEGLEGPCPLCDGLGLAGVIARDEQAAASAAPEASPPSGTSAPPELGEWLALLGLAHRREEAVRWCDDLGASFLEEVAEHVEDLAEALCLSPAETSRARSGARSALLAVMPGDVVCKGASQRTRSSTGGCSLRTLSTAVTSLASGAGGPCAGDPEARPFRTGSKGIARILSISATMSAAVQHMKKGLRSDSSKSDPVLNGRDTADEEVCQGGGVGRTCTVEINGPRTAGILAHMAINGGSMQIAQVPRADLHRVGSFDHGDASKMMTPMSREAKKNKEKSMMSRCDTMGVMSLSGANRERLVNLVHQEDVHEVSIDAGQTGNVYALEVGHEKIAVFKPVEGEKFTRKSLDPGQGSVREEAVYLVDRIVGSQAGVPVTSRASLKVDGEELIGSVQAFVDNAIGFIEDFAMPRDVQRAEDFVPQEAAEALALLDMRAFNMDRHSGNLLLLGREKPHGLGPIDHGCCLPRWWSLGEAIFDAWSSWPQLLCPPREATRNIARRAYEKLPETCGMVRDVGLDEASIVTLRLCTLFVFIGVAELGLPCGKLAALMLRDEDTGFQDLSWLEEKVLVASVSAGAQCQMQINDREDQELVVEDNGESLQVDAFLEKLEGIFREELQGAVSTLKSNTVDFRD